MPNDQYVPYPEDVQHLGLIPDPDEIARQIEVLTRRKAEAQRTVLQCDLEVAKLLAILADHHGYRNRRYVAFAAEHGRLSRTDSYDLVKLAPAAFDIVAEHDEAALDDPLHEWPSWRQAMRDLEPEEEGGYWLTPPDLYSELDAEFHFDSDPFPHPRPVGYDALADDVEWGQCSYVNASFRSADEGSGRSLSKVVPKVEAELNKGKIVVMPIPCYDPLAKLLILQPEVRPLGRVKW